MCRRVNCSKCGKPSYAGCGMHVEQVLGNVPRDQRCRCRESAGPGDKQGGGSPGWLRGLFGQK